MLAQFKLMERLFYACIVIVVAALIGGVLYRRGRRGTRVGTEPRCRKCEYNLTGLASNRCPECGAVLTDTTVDSGLRQPRPVSRVLGFVLLLPFLGCVGSIVVFAVYAWITEPKFTYTPPPRQIREIVDRNSGFGFGLIEQRRFSEAETLLRGCLELLPKSDWRMGRVTSLLGESLARQEKFEEAEPFLLNGYATMKGDPKANPLRVDEARQRIVKFCEAWGKPEKAEAFRVTQADSAQVPGEPTP